MLAFTWILQIYLQKVSVYALGACVFVYLIDFMGEQD